MRRTGYPSIGLALASMLVVATSCGEPTAPAAGPGVPEVGSMSAAAPRPTLVACQSSAAVSAQGTIGLLGGSVSAGGTTIVIPPGAVLFPQTFDVTVPASRLMEVQVTAVGHDRFQFLLPVLVTIDYSRCRGNSSVLAHLSVYYIDDSTKALLALMAGTDDKVAQRYTFVTDHLSGYAIAN
ncbi:MAG: hypothetical protein H0X64_15995 [Gemmatimonadaceae bacterium]|nr:hypothetical protein [Gemmatimonadaceae bacterium]